MRRLRFLMALGFVLVSPRPAGAGEVQLVSAALFGRLNRTATFDVNADGDISAADIVARVHRGVPRSEGCGGPAPPAGRQTIQVGTQQRQRQYVVRLPAEFDNTRPRPVVFGFHGFGGDAASQERTTELAANWPDAIGVYGEGLLRTFPTFPGAMGQGWQIFPGEFDDRDVLFFDAVLARLKAQYCINPRRVYATGFSNGAFFSHVLGCVRGAVIAAIGPRAGGVLNCPGRVRVAVVISHGTADNVVPFSFGTGARNLWLRRNGCSAGAVPYAAGCEISRECASDRQVAFCQWPGTHTPDPKFPPNLFRFFREHAL